MDGYLAIVSTGRKATQVACLLVLPWAGPVLTRIKVPPRPQGKRNRKQRQVNQQDLGCCVQIHVKMEGHFARPKGLSFGLAPQPMTGIELPKFKIPGEPDRYRLTAAGGRKEPTPSLQTVVSRS